MGSNTKFNHNKKRNSGLVYEFLTRKMSECVLDGDKRGYSTAFSMIKKYFSPGQPIETERALFDPIVSTRGVNRSVAHGTIKEVARSASRLDFKLVDIKKSNLIKEIHTTFGKEFFSEYKIDDYRAFASIQLLINGCNPKRTIVEGVQRVKLEESLVEYMMSTPREKQEIGEHDELVYAIAMKKFNDRYSSALNEDQRKILGSYISALSSGERAESAHILNLREKRKEMLKEIDGAFSLNEIAEDDLMRNKLVEARGGLEALKLDRVSESDTEDMLLFAKLVEEIRSDE